MGALASKASHAIDQVKDTAPRARRGLVDLGVYALKLLDSIRTQELRAVDSVLGHVGLQRRASARSPLWLLAAGAAVGGAVALVLATTPGKKLRGKLRDLLGAAKESAPANPKTVEERVDAALASDASKSSNGANQPGVAGPS